MLCPNVIEHSVVCFHAAEHQVFCFNGTDYRAQNFALIIPEIVVSVTRCEIAIGVKLRYEFTVEKLETAEMSLECRAQTDPCQMKGGIDFADSNWWGYFTEQPLRSHYSKRNGIYGWSWLRPLEIMVS